MPDKPPQIISDLFKAEENVHRQPRCSDDIWPAVCGHHCELLCMPFYASTEKGGWSSVVVVVMRMARGDLEGLMVRPLLR